MDRKTFSDRKLLFENDEAQRAQNLSKNLPARYGFKWNDIENTEIVTQFNRGMPIIDLSYAFERPKSGIISKLKKLEAINDNQYEIMAKEIGVKSFYNKSIQKERIKDSFSSFKTYSLWHLTHFSNINSILKLGILSHNDSINFRINDISEHSVQDKRAVTNDPIYKACLHSYVPLFLRNSTPMLYSRRELKDELVFIEVDVLCIMQDGYLISDGNAASRKTKFYSSIDSLDKLPWTVLDADYWNEHYDGKRKRSAEVLVPKKVSPQYFKALHCHGTAVHDKLSFQGIHSELSENLFF
jgi:hypothetical protein